ncbi:hypothetical protein [Streptomyces microflavus]|uniref:hypothetical protein n=1 Tax=Streptomyces microflavus TaxID=1919 RepID=UPI0033BEC80A
MPSPDQSCDAQSVPEGLIALIGSVQGPEDLAERHDDYLRERLERRFGKGE